MNTPDTHTLQTHLQEHAREYFDDFTAEPITVRLRRSSRRINSTLYEFALATESLRHHVLVKIPFAIKNKLSSARMDAVERPRLSPKPSTDQKCQHEYLTLCAIARNVRDAADPRFSAVRVLDLLPQHSVLLMERISACSLNRSLLKASRLSYRSATDVRQACRHGGAWLSFFHRLPNLPQTQTRCQTRDDFIDSIDRFTDYLGRMEDDEFFSRIRKQIIPHAEVSLPDHLPLGLSHGDYAPRNVLVDQGCRVSIIDTLGRWRAPIFEDISRFLCALHVSQPQVWLQGWAYSRRVLDELERHFLQGYFAEHDIPYQQIRLFQCQALLDRWASFVNSCRSSRGIRRWAKNGRRWWWRRYFSYHLRHTIEQLTAKSERQKAMLENVA